MDSSGAMIATVLENIDENGLGRIKIKLNNGDTYWARMTNLMAGADRGVFFMPEKEDEVLVVFEEGEISRPFIVGSLWSTQDKPPEVNDTDDKNNIKLIKTRTGQMIEMSDEEKKGKIEVTSSSGHKVLLSDEDGKEKIEVIDKSSKNMITIDTANNTISISSDKDINIDAPNGTIKLSSKNLEIANTANTKIESKGIAMNGGSGTVEIKGSLVKIN